MIGNLLKDSCAGVTSLGQTILLSFGCNLDLPFRYCKMGNGRCYYKMLRFICSQKFVELIPGPRPGKWRVGDKPLKGNCKIFHISYH